MSKVDLRIKSPDGTLYSLEELLLVSKVMKLFKVTRVTVYNWLGPKSKNDGYPDGKFPHAFKNGKIYIPTVDVKEMIKKTTM